MAAPQLQTYCDAAKSCRERDTPAATGRDTRRLTVGAAETSGMRCSAGLCRVMKPKSPERQRRKIRLPRQRVGDDAATSLVERTEVPEHRWPQRRVVAGDCEARRAGEATAIAISPGSQERFRASGRACPGTSGKP